MVVELTFEYIQYEDPDGLVPDGPHPLKPTLGPTQHSVQCAPGLFSGRKVAGA